jgi:eukaryotic-like serine/threonine-protein kinase
VARRRELDVLRRAWAEARAGQRRLLFVAGEPGIGKTRLAKEFAHAVQWDGTVLYAACQEEALVSYRRHEAGRLWLDRIAADLSAR